MKFYEQRLLVDEYFGDFLKVNLCFFLGLLTIFGWLFVDKVCVEYYKPDKQLFLIFVPRIFAALVVGHIFISECYQKYLPTIYLYRLIALLGAILSMLKALN